MNHLFSVVFEDDTCFNGGDSYYDTKWQDIPNKRIRSIFYRMPCGDYICLSGYEKYYHYVEAIKDLNGKYAGKALLQSDYLLAKKRDKVIQYKFDLSLDYFKVERKEFDAKDSYITSLNQKFWK